MYHCGDSAYFDGFTRIGWPTVVLLGVLTALAFAADIVGSLLGAQRVGASRRALAGAALGTLAALPFGLAGYAFTRSLKNADLLTRRLEVGMLWINTPPLPTPEMPFGGLKESGYGSEGGPEALEAYLNVRAVGIMNA